MGCEKVAGGIIKVRRRDWTEKGGGRDGEVREIIKRNEDGIKVCDAYLCYDTKNDL